MKFRLDSYCGLYCGACFVMNAYKQNRKNCLPEEWISPIDNKEIKCYGCKSELVFENCTGCRIRNCAQSKNIEFCNICPEFPCDYTKRFESINLAHHNIAIQSLKRISEIGVEEWLKQQEKRWLCPNCKYPFSWYEENCVQCGTELFNSIKENKK